MKAVERLQKWTKICRSTVVIIPTKPRHWWILQNNVWTGSDWKSCPHLTIFLGHFPARLLLSWHLLTGLAGDGFADLACHWCAQLSGDWGALLLNHFPRHVLARRLGDLPAGLGRDRRHWLRWLAYSLHFRSAFPKGCKTHLLPPIRHSCDRRLHPCTQFAYWHNISLHSINKCLYSRRHIYWKKPSDPFCPLKQSVLKTSK